jgi:hypothetical protein
MKHYVTALVLAGGLAAAQANAACTYPVPPGKFPDGGEASKEEMLAAKKQVVQYNTDMDAYLGCLKTEFEAQATANPNASTEQKEKLAREQDEKHNAAVKEVTDVTDRFNEQLRAWKAKNPSTKEKKTS